jgi:sulfur carrier protein ThiS adenylyltransferase
VVRLESRIFVAKDCGNMNLKEIKTVLLNKKVGIAGCGGLGSNAAVALARVGVKKFVLVDFDVIEPSNLNRQYYFKRQIGQKKVEALKYNLLEIDEDIEIITLDLKLEYTDITQVFEGCNLVIEAFDKAEAKQMIAEAMIENMPSTPLILGIGMAGIGDFHLIKQEKWSDNIYICGDSASEISEDLPPLAPRVGIVANMQANLALELLLA